jgi:hypothetical protein
LKIAAIPIRSPCGGWCGEKRQLTEKPKKMVLPDRIELSTSPLPMECSTTELRQHAPDHENRPKGPLKAGRSLPQGARLRKRGTPLWDAKNRQIGAEPRAFADICRYWCEISPARWTSGARTLIAACISAIGRGTNSDRFAMTDDSNRAEGQTAGAARNPRHESRQQRLKQALRENLKRRKTQARGRGDPASRPSNADDVLPYDDGNKPGE